MSAVLPEPYRRDEETGVWSRPGRAAFAYSDGDASEDYLLGVMREESDRSCASDGLPGRIRDWPSEYHLSPHRYNLLRPLRVTPDTRVLEIGAGCGALTRWLGERGAQVLALEGSARRAAITAARCRDLPNVSVCAEDFQHFDAPAEYDLVTLVGVLEYAPVIFEGDDPVGRCLAMARARLAAGGTLALAIENRLGLKYFNGCSEDHTGRAFDSINDLYPPKSCRTFGRQELTARLQAAGFTRVEGLYPFPDYKLPRCIVGERALAREDLDVGQIIGQYPARDYTGKGLRLFNEALAWRCLADNGLVPDMANSFLLLAGTDGGAPLDDDWLLSVFTGDRRSCFRTQTRFRRSGSGIAVDKARLHPERDGADGPMRYRERGPQPYLSGERLSDALPALTFHGDAFARYLDYLRGYLGALRELAGAGPGDALPGGFIDCIPPNVVRAADGGYRFIDDEWAADEDVSAGFMAFRAVINDLARVGAFGTLFLFEGCADMRGFVTRVLAALGLEASPRAVDDHLRREAAILAQVNAPRPDAEAYFASVLRAQLATPPHRLLSVVMDETALQAVVRDHHFGRPPPRPAPD